MIEQRVTLRYGAQQIPAIVQAVQGDTGRDVIFELADYEIPAGATANYYIDKPDDTAIYNSAEVISSTEILAHLTEQALAAPGRNNGQVRILSDGEVITSFDFVLEVEAFRGILRLQSETEINIFDQAIEDAVNTATEEAVAEIQAQTPVVTGMQNSIAPTYSSSSTYAVGDYVMYNAQLYRCITAITTAEAWTAAHWTQVPLADDVNGLKSAVSEKAPISLINQNNLLFGKSVIDNKYYWEGWADSTNMFVVVVPVVSGAQYTMVGIRFVSGQTEGLFNNAGYTDPQTWTSTVDGDVYISVPKGYKNVAFFCTKENYDNGDYGTLGTPILNHDLIADEIGDSDNLLVSQKLLTESLSSPLSNAYVELTGENQVTPQNIAGMQFTKTERDVDGENIFSADMLWRAEFYVVVDNGVVAIGSNAVFNAYCVPVEKKSTYVFPECRFAVLATGNILGSPAIGDTMQYASQVTTGEATHLFLSYANKPVSEITVKKKVRSFIYTDFVLPDWLNQKPVKKPKFKSASGSLSDGSALIVQGCRNNTRKGERVIFYGNITSFNSISFGISVSDNSLEAGVCNTFTIDATNITYTQNQYSTPVVVQHGLTIADNIQIIGEEGATGTYKITIISGGSLFMHEFNYLQQVIGAPYVSSAGSVITDAKLTWTCMDLDKQIWMFGDSYFAYSPERWTYYLHEYGYDKNCLLDGWPGMGSVNAKVSFVNMLNYGTPRFAVWCMGMNDGGDSGAAPSTDWSTQRDIFLQYCNENEVTPVFATIPTVPTVNNEAKNSWVRSSGYRYIDFALAVGATSSGAWYSGMLSSDNVHPTEKGAKALFARFLVDFPEIIVTE